jgi:hypothetical protein
MIGQVQGIGFASPFAAQGPLALPGASLLTAFVDYDQADIIAGTTAKQIVGGVAGMYPIPLLFACQRDIFTSNFGTNQVYNLKDQTGLTTDVYAGFAPVLVSAAATYRQTAQCALQLNNKASNAGFGLDVHSLQNNFGGSPDVLLRFYVVYYFVEALF